MWPTLAWVSFFASAYDVLRRIAEATGALELLVKAQMAPAARKIKATFCPSDDVTEPEYIAMGGENTGKLQGAFPAAICNNLQIALDPREHPKRFSLPPCNSNL